MLNISIVLYHPKWEEEVLPLVTELLKVKNLRKIYLLDNSEEKETPPSFPSREDIRVKAEDIDAMHDWMMVNPLVGQLMPKVVNPDGSQQYLAKRLPSPLDVFGRRFLPEWMIARRNKRYELRDLDLTRPVNAPYLSGCFMMLRTKAAVEAGLFDERFFMYPEDIDLTRRIHRNTITHAHARSSYNNKHMLRIHIQNMCLYFNKWGWLFDKERRLFNQFKINN